MPVGLCRARRRMHDRLSARRKLYSNIYGDAAFNSIEFSFLPRLIPYSHSRNLSKGYTLTASDRTLESSVPYPPSKGIRVAASRRDASRIVVAFAVTPHCDSMEFPLLPRFIPSSHSRYVVKQHRLATSDRTSESSTSHPPSTRILIIRIDDIGETLGSVVECPAESGGARSTLDFVPNFVSQCGARP